MRVLFVCTGNTCRSPIAEAAFNALAAAQDLPHLARSAGLAAFDGAPAADEAAEAVAARFSADLSGHRARPVRREDVDAADVVMAMTEAHRRELVRRFPDAEPRIRTLVPGHDIADPIGRGREAYAEALSEIEAAVRAWLSRNA